MNERKRKDPRSLGPSRARSRGAEDFRAPAHTRRRRGARLPDPRAPSYPVVVDELVHSSRSERRSDRVHDSDASVDVAHELRHALGRVRSLPKQNNWGLLRHRKKKGRGGSVSGLSRRGAHVASSRRGASRSGPPRVRGPCEGDDLSWCRGAHRQRGLSQGAAGYLRVPCIHLARERP